jgi:hypothetical protein
MNQNIRKDNSSGKAEKSPNFLPGMKQAENKI